MEAAFELPVSLMEDVRGQVGELNTKVAVLATQHGYLIEAINRVELAVRAQSVTSDEYRKTLMAEVLRTTDTVKAMEIEIEIVKQDLTRLTDRTLGAWMRKNAGAIAVTVTVIVTLVGLIRWMISHYR